MGSMSIMHWMIVLAVVLLIFGTKKLRTLGGDAGAAIRDFKGALSDGQTPAQAASQATAPSREPVA